MKTLDANGSYAVLCRVVCSALLSSGASPTEEEQEEQEEVEEELSVVTRVGGLAEKACRARAESQKSTDVS